MIEKSDPQFGHNEKKGLDPPPGRGRGRRRARKSNSVAKVDQWLGVVGGAPARIKVSGGRASLLRGRKTSCDRRREDPSWLTMKSKRLGGAAIVPSYHNIAPQLKPTAFYFASCRMYLDTLLPCDCS